MASWKDRAQVVTDEPVKKGSWKDRATSIEDKPSSIESAARGGLQGATLGFSDELIGGAEALFKGAFGDDNFNQEDLLANYKKYRDESRSANKAAEEANPGTYLTGDIAGSIAPSLLTGGAAAAGNLGRVALTQSAKQLAKAGAVQGAASGLGLSEEGDLSGLATDTAIGGGVGAAAGAVLPSIGKGLGKVVGATGDYIKDKAPAIVQRGTEAFDLAKKGIKVVGNKAEEALNTDALKLSEDILSNIEKKYKTSSKMVGKSLELSDKGPQNVSSQMRRIESLIDDSKITPDDKKKLLDIFDLYKEEFTKKVGTESGLDTALNKINASSKKAKSAANALGDDISFSPVENIDNEFLQSVKTSNLGSEVIDNNKVIQEGTGLKSAEEKMKQKIAKLQAESAQLGENVTVTPPVFDEESSSLISIVRSTDKNGKDIAKTITQSVPKDAVENIPVMGDKLSANVMQVDIPKDKDLLETYTKFQGMSLQDLMNLKKQFGDVGYSAGDSLSNFAKSKAKETSKLLEEVIESKMTDPKLKNAYKLGNKGMSDVHGASDLFGEVGSGGLTDKNKITFAEKLKSNSQKNSNLIDSLVPLLGSGGTEVAESANELATRKGLSNIMKSEGGILGGMINPRGMSVRGGEALGTVSKSIEPITNISKSIFKADDSVLTAIANKAKSTPGLEGFSRSLEEAVKDSGKRDRILWALSQQPAFKEMFKRELEQSEQQN